MPVNRTSAVPLASNSAESFASLLKRPLDQRVREFKYRFAQSVVFGLPVLALQRYGLALGWVEAGRWAGVLQLLLAGWVMYVGAAGMLFEGLLTLRKKPTADFTVALLAIALYLWSAVGFFALLTRAGTEHRLLFDASVGLIAGWSAARWWRMARSEPG